MGGVSIEFRATTRNDGGLEVVYYFEYDSNRLETSLTAAVAWRGCGATSAGWRGTLRSWQYRVGIDPLHRRFWIRDRGWWIGSAGPNGEHETLFNPQRRVIRVLGRVYDFPPKGTTLVLLADEGTSPANVQHKLLEAPIASGDMMQPLYVSHDGDHIQRGHSEFDVWRDVLRGDPEIAAFMEMASET